MGGTSMWDRNISDAKNLKEQFSAARLFLSRQEDQLANKWMSARMQLKNEQFSSQELRTIHKVIVEGDKYVVPKQRNKRAYCKCQEDVNFKMEEFCILCPYNERLLHMKVLNKEKSKELNNVHKFTMPVIKKLIDIVEADSIYGIAADFDSWMEDVTNYEADCGDTRVNLEVGSVFIKPVQKRKIQIQYEDFDTKCHKEEREKRVSYEVYRKIIRTLFKWEGFIGSVPFPLRLYGYLQGKYVREDILLTKYLFHWSKYESGGSKSYNHPGYHESPE